MRLTGYILRSVIVLLFISPLRGQEPDSKSRACDCALAFNDMISKLERNYIGLKQLQMAEKEKDYTYRKRDYASKAADIRPQDCAAFLDEFLCYFNDGHLHVIERPAYAATDVERFKK